MTSHTPQVSSTASIDRITFVIPGDARPPRDPEDDEEEQNGSEEEEDRTEEPPVVREPDED
ncbi:MAG TPA: hypothetical protein VJR30_17775 [Bradyrhizobium sp.]|nr:hypothetical protein [Bradyrhizobium sp.]